MSTPKQRLDQLILQHDAKQLRRCVGRRIFILASSFTEIYDGLTISHSLPDSLRHVTLCTFQVVDLTQYSLFVNAPHHALTIEDYDLIQVQILQHLTPLWRIITRHFPTIAIANCNNELVFVRAGRRFWNTAVVQEHNANPVWYNPRPQLPTTSVQPTNETPPRTISPLSIVGPTALYPNMDGTFQPDADFTAEEVL